MDSKPLPMWWSDYHSLRIIVDKIKYPAMSLRALPLNGSYTTPMAWENSERIDRCGGESDQRWCVLTSTISPTITHTSAQPLLSTMLLVLFSLSRGWLFASVSLSPFVSLQRGEGPLSMASGVFVLTCVCWDLPL